MFEYMGVAQIETVAAQAFQQLIEAGIGVMAVILAIAVVIVGGLALWLDARREKNNQRMVDVLITQNNNQARTLDEFRGQGESLKQMVENNRLAAEDNRRKIEILMRLDDRSAASALGMSKGFDEIAAKLDDTATRLSDVAAKEAQTALESLQAHITKTGDHTTSTILAKLTEALEPLTRLEQESRLAATQAAQRHELLVGAIDRAKQQVITAFKDAIETPPPPDAAVQVEITNGNAAGD